MILKAIKEKAATARRKVVVRKAVMKHRRTQGRIKRMR